MVPITKDDSTPSFSRALSPSRVALTMVQAGPLPQSREACAERVAPSRRAPSTRSSLLASPPHPSPQDQPTARLETNFIPASAGPPARDSSRTLAIVGLPTSEGYSGEETGSGSRAWLPETPPPRLRFKHRFPRQSRSRAARHSNRGSAGLRAGTRREQALRTNSRPRALRTA